MLEVLFPNVWKLNETEAKNRGVWKMVWMFGILCSLYSIYTSMDPINAYMFAPELRAFIGGIGLYTFCNFLYNEKDSSTDKAAKIVEKIYKGDHDGP